MGVLHPDLLGPGLEREAHRNVLAGGDIGYAPEDGTLAPEFPHDAAVGQDLDHSDRIHNDVPPRPGGGVLPSVGIGKSHWRVLAYAIGG